MSAVNSGTTEFYLRINNVFTPVTLFLRVDGVFVQVSGIGGGGGGPTADFQYDDGTSVTFDDGTGVGVT